MSEWKDTELRDICTGINYGYTASAVDTSIGPKFLRITDIAKDTINWNTVPYCSISEKDINKYRLELGDIVIARTGATTGYNAVIKDNIEAVFASYLIRYRINRDLADPFFIGHLLQSTNWFGFVENIVSGSAQPGANAQMFADFKFKLPSLPEQNGISDILNSFVNKIDLLHRQNKTLEQLAETLFRQWFVEEAEDWKDGKLSDVLELIYGKTLKEENRSGGGFPVVGSSGIVGYHSKYLVEKPGIVIGRKGTLGKVNYMFENFFPIDTTYYVKSKVNSDGLFYEYFLLKNLNLVEMNSDSAVPGLNRNIAHSIEVKIPSEELISDFNNQCLILFEKINTNSNQIRTLTQLRDTLLPKLISGEVRVGMTNTINNRIKCK